MKKIIYIVSLLMVMTSCSSGFLKEYSQDLGRVKTYTDLNELLVGSGYLPLGVFNSDDSQFSYENLNFMLVHFMGDELSENDLSKFDTENIGTKNLFYPYFTWQKNTYMSYEGKDIYDSEEKKPWALAYERIANLNMILAQADLMSPSTEEEKVQDKTIRGEAHFLRANYYYMLVNLYAKPYAPSTAASTLGVPIKLTEYIEDKDYVRNSVKEVYDQINADLDAAEIELKDVTKLKSIYHAGINAVYLFRSRIYLYMQDWVNAEKYAKLSLEQNSNLLNLVGYSTSLYPLNETSPEIIFSNGSSALGNMLFQSPGSRSSSLNVNAPDYYISDHLYNLYDKSDARRTAYITKTDDKATSLPTYHKIDCSKASYSQYKKVSDVFALRSSEAYLNLAEAAAQQGDNSTACQYLNRLRAARIADAASINLSGAELIQFVREERERELFLEGHRWFDLRRYMVDANYPYTTIIEHGYTYYAYVDYSQLRQHTDFYRLEKNDEGYTLNIPKAVREYQVSIGSNERPERTVVRTVSY